MVSDLNLDTFEKHSQESTMKKIAFLLIGASILQLTACSDNETTTPTDTTTKPVINAPAFDAENAYKFIETQVAFGPRVPGTLAQKNVLLG